MAHQVEGPRDGIPLLLLQGQANSHVWWHTVRPLLVEHFLTITFDYRGTGATAALQAESGREDESTWSTRSFAADAAAVLAALGVRDALVYGTSMGGRIAQELAIARPELVRRLVLACTTPGGRLARERSREVRLALADSDRHTRFRALVDVFYTPAWTATHGGYDRVPTHLFGDPGISRRDANRHLRMSAAHDASDRLQFIETPTLVLHGTDDVFAPVSNATVLAEHIVGSQLRIYPGGRHGFFDEFATAVTAEVASYLRG